MCSTRRILVLAGIPSLLLCPWLLVSSMGQGAQLRSPRAMERPFHMGFTAFPYDFTAAAQDETYDWIAGHSDLITFHHDGGVPWPEALDGTHRYHPNLIAEIDDQAANVRPGQVVYVSATPQSTRRAGELAPYWGVDTNLPLPPPWDGYHLDHPDVVQAFTNWCRYLILRLHPDYFAYAIECNGGFSGLADPGFWEFLALVLQVYPVLKAENPSLPVFLTVQTGSTESPRSEFLQITSALLSHSDLVGISSYPFIVLRQGGFDTYGDPADIPEDLLTSITALAPGKPMAITETGYIAEDLAIPDYALFQEGREEWQADYVAQVLGQAHGLDAEFVVWFVPRDYDLGIERLISLGVPVDPSFYIWRDNGLLDGQGGVRRALRIWDGWLSVPYVP